jgi:hypothetical protein
MKDARGVGAGTGPGSVPDSEGLVRAGSVPDSRGGAKCGAIAWLRVYEGAYLLPRGPALEAKKHPPNSQNLERTWGNDGI